MYAVPVPLIPRPCILFLCIAVNIAYLWQRWWKWLSSARRQGLCITNTLFTARPSLSEYFLSDRLQFKERDRTPELQTGEARAALASGPKCWGKQKHYAKYRPASAIPRTLFARGRVIVLSNWTSHLAWCHVLYSFGVICCLTLSRCTFFPRIVTTLCRQTNFETVTVDLNTVRQIMVTLIIAGHWAWCFMM